MRWVSRYENTKQFESAAFAGKRERRILTTVGVIEHTVKDGDRLFALARHYYGDDRLWWRIVDANPEFLYGADMVLLAMKGRPILIPGARG